MAVTNLNWTAPTILNLSASKSRATLMSFLHFTDRDVQVRKSRPAPCGKFNSGVKCAADER